ncbi:hypothetical protein GYMLUDRAFT_176388 [Collybiopsis luxurians FD-317 M1]|uniref:HTH CENPB-type domain-containing protein n=1 Tax=Collybiopsis luxurians FD-317 M1 TaxID=944289 RepID=A0A0D0CIX3_9AGAR|nr:hypothetical protein GYMLUDRAFT_176388 [Collybiopsis luxurians FD-317 M1]
MAINCGVQGYRTIREFNATKQKLLPAEEQTLADFMLCSAESGLPLTHSQIKSYANAILQKKHGPTYEGVGCSWIYKFLKRNHKVSMHWSKPLNMQCA